MSRVIATHLIALLCLIIFSMAFGAEQYNIFSELRDKVTVWRQKATDAQLNEIAEAEKLLTSCPNKQKFDGTTAIVVINGHRFRYRNKDLPDNRYCFYIIEPFDKALTVDEARTFTEAIVLHKNSDELNTKSNQTQPRLHLFGADKFNELLTTAASKRYELTKNNQLPTDYGNYVDCSNDSPAKLSQIEGNQTTSFIYNAIYVWKVISRDDGICVFVEEPLDRGLQIDEAKTFIQATQLHLGVSQKYIEEHTDDPRLNMMLPSDDRKNGIA